MRLRLMAIGSITASLLLLGACGSAKDSDEEAAAAKPAKTESAQKNDQDTAEETSKAEEQTNADGQEENNTDSDKTEEKGSAENLNPYIEEETGGDMEIVFTNTDPGFTHAYSDKVSLTIDEYQIAHVTNMNESAKHNFDDEDEGYVITYKFSFDTQLDEDVFYNASTMMLSDDGTENLYMRRSLVDESDWLKGDKDTAGRQFSAGTYTGMQAYTMTAAQYERLTAPTLTVDRPMLEDDFKKSLGEEAVFKIPFNDEGAEKSSKSSALYADKMVTDTIADKEIFFAKEDINETKKIDEVSVTLEGVQYADITPTAAHASRFSNFGDGPLIALTAKFQVTNDSDSAFAKDLADARLILDKDRGTMLSEGMLEPALYDNLQPGESEEFLKVFLFRKDEFELLKDLSLEFGPLADENAKKLYKEKSVTFELPMK